MKLRDRRDMLNYIARCMEQDGKAWFHWRYRVSKKLTDIQVRNMAMQYYLDPDEEYLHFTQGDLDGRAKRWE